MRFLVDAQLPPALVGWLAARGHEAEHVADREMQTASDAAIWDYALVTSAVIVTKDEDFAQRKVLTTAAATPDDSGSEKIPQPRELSDDLSRQDGTH